MFFFLVFVFIGGENLIFSLDFEKYDERNYRLQVRDALLFLPQDCVVSSRGAGEEKTKKYKNLKKEMTRKIVKMGEEDEEEETGAVMLDMTRPFKCCPYFKAYSILSIPPQLCPYK